METRENGATFTTGPNTAQEPRLMGKRKRDKERNKDADLDGRMEGKRNPGNCYRKRLEPVLLGLLDLRNRRDAITERRGKVPEGRRKTKKEGAKQRGRERRKERMQKEVPSAARTDIYPLILLLYQNNAPPANRISSNRINTGITMDAVPAHINTNAHTHLLRWSTGDHIKGKFYPKTDNYCGETRISHCCVSGVLSL